MNETGLMYDLKNLFDDLLNPEIDINISYQKVVAFNAKHNVVEHERTEINSGRQEIKSKEEAAKDYCESQLMTLPEVEQAFTAGWDAAIASQFTPIASKEAAVEFAEWITRTAYMKHSEKKGWHRVGRAGLDPYYTTEQLYKLFKEQNHGK